MFIAKSRAAPFCYASYSPESKAMNFISQFALSTVSTVPHSDVLRSKAMIFINPFGFLLSIAEPRRLSYAMHRIAKILWSFLENCIAAQLSLAAFCKDRPTKAKILCPFLSLCKEEHRTAVGVLPTKAQNISPFYTKQSTGLLSVASDAKKAKP